jgi:3-methylfumaryl-CoA hydratase
MTDDPAAWIGRSRTQADEITRPALLRIASLLDREMDFPAGAPIPAHWYAMFFPEIARQSELGVDGHPRRGDFLPPIPLPRRMFAGRRTTFHTPLRVGDVATKTSTISAIAPKRGRSGEMVFVTLRHAITVASRLAVEEEQDVVYREAPAPGAAPPAATAAPEAAEWTTSYAPTTTLLFRYSAITWNGHRIHYDADYARAEEAYPALVVNGGLTLLMLLEAAIAAHGRAPRQLAVRNVSPLFAGHAVTLAGGPVVDGTAQAWAASHLGALSVSATLDY